ncbi:MAG: hypothetical protein H6Q11_1710 [Acidobacteria bacterium]|nr:hypothetical protein [Acidobacteriota bacterium]
MTKLLDSTASLKYTRGWVMASTGGAGVCCVMSLTRNAGWPSVVTLLAGLTTAP